MATAELAPPHRDARDGRPDLAQLNRDLVRMADEALDLIAGSTRPTRRVALRREGLGLLALPPHKRKRPRLQPSTAEQTP